MQTVETLNEGLKRAYTLKITAKDIESRVDAELKRVAPTVKMPGFRPGKVPANLVRKMHGDALMQALIAHGVIGDFRAPDLMRLGFAPLYNGFVDIVRAAEVLGGIVASGEWDQPRFHARAKIT